MQKEDKEGVVDKKSTLKGKGGGQDWIRKNHSPREWMKPVLIRAHRFSLEGLETYGLVCAVAQISPAAQLVGSKHGRDARTQL